LITKSLKKKRISGKGTNIKDISGNIQGAVISIRDETEKLKSREKLTYLSFHDSLTGLYNRAYFDAELERLNSTRQLPLSIIVGDVNGLKLTNDVFGHAEGDRFLVNIARILKESCRYEDIIARWGGDEFSIILPYTLNKDALEICKRIKEKCEISDPVPIKPSIALGVSTKLGENQSISRKLTEAEDAMYKNKLIEGKKVRSEIISILLKILQERSSETIEHCNRMQNLANKIQHDFHLTEREGEDLISLANLHDIGNISVSKNIFLKPEKLNDAEWSEIKKHPEIGYRIAQSTTELVHIADLILAHHERWDGSGYPQGLRGEQIPKLSRILALMDTYDTITHDMPYRKAMSQASAIEEIRRCTGSQFDPVLAEIFLSSICKIFGARCEKFNVSEISN